MKKTGLLLAAAIVAGLFLLACGNGGEHKSAATIFDSATQRGAYGVGVTTIELDDTTRATAANHEFAGSNDRKLTVEVWYPTAPQSGDENRDAQIDAEDVPYPLIVFAHGLSGNRRQSVQYTQHLASHGYIIAAPDFPLSFTGAPGGPRLNAVLEQPKDVSFVIDKMLEFNGEDGHRLNGSIDEDRIGVSGHSLGAMTSFMSIYGPDRDERIKAALPFATPGCFFADGFSGDVSVPVLFTTGTKDLITPPVSSDHVYDIANSPRYLVTIAGADHTRFADIDISDEVIVNQGILENIGQGDFMSDAISTGQALGGNLGTCALGGQPSSDALMEGERQREILRIVGTIFFDGYLRDDGDSVKFLRDGLASSVPEVTVQSDLG